MCTVLISFAQPENEKKAQALPELSSSSPFGPIEQHCTHVHIVSCFYCTVQLPGASLASVEVLLTVPPNFWVEERDTDRPRHLGIEPPGWSLTFSVTNYCCY